MRPFFKQLASMVESPNDWCGQCGKLLDDTLCPSHGVPDDTVDKHDAERIEDEQRHGFDG